MVVLLGYLLWLLILISNLRSIHSSNDEIGMVTVKKMTFKSGSFLGDVRVLHDMKSFVAAGKISFTEQTNGLVAIKFNSDGLQEWGRLYRTNSDQRILAVACDGGVVVGAKDGWHTVIKTSSEGDTEWVSRTVEGSDPFSMTVAHDCGFVGIGSRASGTANLYIWKLFSNGTTEWIVEVGEDSFFSAASTIIKDVDGEGYIFSAYSNSLPPNDRLDFVLGKIYDNGTFSWINAYCQSSDHQLHSTLAVHENGDIILYGSANFGSVIRISSNGSAIIWSKRFTNMKMLSRGFVVLTLDGVGVVVGGVGSSDFGVVSKLNFSDGKLVWSKRMKSPSQLYSSGTDIIYGGVLAPSGNIMFAGVVDFTTTNNKVYVSTIDPTDGNMCNGEDYTSSLDPYDLTINPLFWSPGVPYTGAEEHDLDVMELPMTFDPPICYSCYHILNQDTSNVCNGDGTCSGKDKCDCNPEAVSQNYDCGMYQCFDVDFNSTRVCNFGNGSCNSPDSCICEGNYFGEDCSIYGCFGYQHNDTRVCGGFGKCTYPGICECDTNYYGENCNVTICGSIFSNDSRVCHSDTKTGNCSLTTRNCTCAHGVSGEDCEVFKCNDKDNTDKDVCSGHGKCEGLETCVCVANYTQPDCSWMCYGEPIGGKKTCSGHGYCIDIDNCTCFAVGTYSGKDCGYWSCFGINVFEANKVCAGHGLCIDLDFCICLLGYSTNDTVNNLGGACTEWNCGSYHKSSKGACNGRGSCVGYNECDCNDDYEGDDCETWSCGIDHKNEQTCNGNGKCIAPKKCDCNFGFTGRFCDENLLYATVMAPILTLSGLGAIAFLLFVFGTICCLSLIVCCLVCCICCMFSFLGVYVLVRQGVGIRKFRKLKNFDLLLKEQQLEDDDSIAHLRINKTLFEIPFEEVKTEGILGEGGSQSIVFKALWRGRTVAFKCFKTRMVCSDQEKFDEFEREVQILSSLSHPNVIRFFGATMNPPRVGIVMEFCSNGEFGDFIRGYRENNENGVGYSLEGKFRILHEIISAMEYLHSRNIIHRDIKSENVLIDELEHAKLMDFGLSKLVDRMSTQKTKRIGTGIYMSPEVINEYNYTEKCDVFSFSILMFIIITENFSPYGSNDFNLELKVAADPSFRPEMKELEDSLGTENEWIINIITKCWDHKPDNRYSFEELGELFKEIQKDPLQRTEDRSLVVKKSSFVGNNTSMEGEVKEKGDVRSENVSLKGKLENLQEKYNDLEGERDYFKEENENLKVELKKLKQQVVNLEGNQIM